MTDVIMGIDPGKNGGIALTADYCGVQIIEVCSYSDENLGRMLRLCGPAVAFVESVHAMPGQGVTSMFNFGKGFGYILGMLDAHNADVRLTRPQEWKKEFDLIGKDKQASIYKAKELFPKARLYRTDRCRKESDGMAEALLIMEYGRRMLWKDTTR